MENYRFKYIKASHSELQCGFVGIELTREDGELTREDGSPFVVILSVEDANQLLADLPEQVRIAKKNSI